MYALGYAFGLLVCVAFMAAVLGLPVALLWRLLRSARRAAPPTPYDDAYREALLAIARRNGRRDAYRDHDELH